jgi:hypothetical protein
LSDGGWSISGGRVAAHVDQINVEALLRDIVHHRETVERQIERGLGRIGGAVDIEKNSLGREACHARRMLVADIELNARIGRRDEVALGFELRAV